MVPENSWANFDQKSKKNSISVFCMDKVHADIPIFSEDDDKQKKNFVFSAPTFCVAEEVKI